MRIQIIGSPVVSSYQWEIYSYIKQFFALVWVVPAEGFNEELCGRYKCSVYSVFYSRGKKKIASFFGYLIHILYVGAMSAISVMTRKRE